MRVEKLIHNMYCLTKLMLLGSSFDPVQSQTVNCETLQLLCLSSASCGHLPLLQIVSLSEQQIKQGLVTCSTGNHALAFVYACGAIKAARDAPSTIYLPCTASSAKVKADNPKPEHPGINQLCCAMGCPPMKNIRRIRY